MSIEALVELLLALGFIGGGVGIGYAVFKRKLSQVRRLVDELDDALRDDKVTDEEFKRLWEAFMAVIKG